jgi:signal transduction histidine kinase
MEENVYRVPAPIPQEAVFLGPHGWPDADRIAGKTTQTFTTPDSARDWLKNESAASTGPVSRLVFLHQDAFAGRGGFDTLGSFLEDLRDLRAPYLPILLHGDLAGPDLVHFFRCGLFDALAVPVADSSWINMLIRAERRLEFRHQSRLILASTGRSQDMLRNLRRQLEGQTERTAREMLQAQESLEAANQQLTEAMAELSLLYRFGRELSNAGNWDAVLREILQSLAGFIGAEGSALILRSAAGGLYSPRQTWRWEESAWDKVLVKLQDQVDASVARNILAPGVFGIDPDGTPGQKQGRRVIALPLEHQEIRLGYLLLLLGSDASRQAVTQRFMPFLQAVQVVLSEEVAGAQMLDRIRDIGVFNTRVLETVNSCIWVIAQDGRTVYCNRAGQELLTGTDARSWVPEEFLFQIGRGQVGKPEDPELTRFPELFLEGLLKLDELAGPLLKRLLGRDHDTFRGEGQISRSDGTGIPVLVQTSVMAGAVRDETWLVVVAEDLRESRKLETERLRADRLEGLVEMSATLAHEIRNPLMGLSAQAELLAGQLSPGDKRTRYIDVITGEVDRINETITRMLNFVRPYEPRFASAHLPQLGRDALDLVRSRADAKSLRLVLSDNEGQPGAEFLTLPVDGAQIQQVLLNLLLNAIDAAPAAGKVQLEFKGSGSLDLPAADRGSRREGPGVGISVTDNGTGFGTADPAKLFRPFYTTKTTGTGLGLSICHKIVLAHGGEISAEHTAGQTAFNITLPYMTVGMESEQLQNKEMS